MLIKQLEYFRKVAQTGSISKAASEFYISQPSITKAIQSLESRYSVKLFERTSSGVLLTEEGRRFLYHTEKVLASADSLQKNFSSNENAAPVSHMKLAFIQLDFVYSLIEEVLREFNEGTVHYILDECDRVSVTEKVLDNQASLGLIVTSFEEGNDVIWKTEADKLEFTWLADSSVVVCAGPKSPFYNQESMNFNDIKCSLNLVLDVGGPQQSFLFFDNMASYLNSNRLIFVNTISACEYFMLHTDAVLYINAWATGLFKDKRIKFFPIANPSKYFKTPRSNNLLLIKRKNYTLNETESMFVDRLKTRFKVK